MAEAGTENIVVRFKCPKCGQMVSVEVPKKVLMQTLGGIATIPVEHGEPPHLLVLYIDQNGMVRGYAVYEHLVKLFDVSLRDLVGIIGPRRLGDLMYWIFIKDKINCVGLDANISKALRLFFNQVFGKQVIGEDGVPINMNEMPNPVISTKPFAQIFEKAMELENPDLALSWIRGEIQRFRQIIEYLIELSKSSKSKKISPRKLMKEYNLSKDELLLAIEIVTEKGLQIKDKINLVELRIKDLLI